MQNFCRVVALGNSDFIVVKEKKILFRSNSLHAVEDFLDYRENKLHIRVGLCNKNRFQKRHL